MIKLNATLKNVIKSLLKLFFGKKPGQISISEDTKVVSFDVFDTLILRKAGCPLDVFDMVQQRYMISESWDFPDSFRNMRIEAERLARKSSDSGEVSLDDIYDNLCQISDTQRKSLKELETNIEKEICYCNREIFDLYQKAQNAGKRTVIVSDMYFSDEFIRSLLDKCGITGYEKLYVSSEYHKNKKHGDLFDVVAHDVNCDASEISHIGDNPFGDYLVPRSKGWRAFLYRKS